MSSASLQQFQTLKEYFLLLDRDAEQNETNHYINTHAFVLGELGLMLNTKEMAVEVVDDLGFCRLPNTANWLMGMANRRGNMVPIIDLGSLLGLEEKQLNTKQKFLIAGQKDAAVGIPINRLPVRLVLDEDDLLTAIPPMPERLHPHIRACYEKDERIWVDWDIPGFFQTVCKDLTIHGPDGEPPH